MLSSAVKGRRFVQKYMTNVSRMGPTRSNVTATVTTFSTNHPTCQTTKQLTNVMASVSNRSFSSNGVAGPIGPWRSQPQYAIFGEKVMMTVKMIPPSFRCLKNGSLVLDGNKKGRIFLEWSPRLVGGGYDRDGQIRFALSPEEIGFLLHQLPENEVEFVRRLPAEPGATAADMSEKVLRITPGEGGQFSFSVDYEKDNVGGQIAEGATQPLGPLEVVAQLGEYVVVRKLLELSIPSLIGWDIQTNYAMQNAINLALQAPYQQPTARPREAVPPTAPGDVAADF